MEESKFLNKYCKLVLNNGFVLYGTVIDLDIYGLLFETKQKTAWHAFANIRELALED